ncbi:MAG: hypothetical protein HZC55_21100 [Verrucomicrobia bacterium]|nr:hypothetical protein [Verrucomicrobiota bacterium]
MRQAIPAALDDSARTQASFRDFEAALVARANGQPETRRERRWAPSRRKT